MRFFFFPFGIFLNPIPFLSFMSRPNFDFPGFNDLEGFITLLSDTRAIFKEESSGQNKIHQSICCADQTDLGRSWAWLRNQIKDEVDLFDLQQDAQEGYSF